MDLGSLFVVICFYSLLWPLECTEYNSCLLLTEDLTNRNVPVIRNSRGYEREKKKNSVDGRGPSNVGLGTFVFFFELCWASLPIPSINHVGEVVGKW